MIAVLDLALAETLSASLQMHARARNLKPLGIAIFDPSGHVVLSKREYGASFIQVDVAASKACTTFSLNASSQKFATMASERPEFANALEQTARFTLAPAADGLRLLSDGNVLGAIGVNGDTSDNDEAAVLAVLADAALQTE